ncbi:MAG: MEDS domain-containing protein [Actinomycetota bacterium]
MAVEAKQPETSAHLVLFYNDDEELAGSVGAYLDEGLAAGEDGVVIATPEHVQRFLRDVMAPSRVQTFDAAQTLERFMIDGKPDPSAFDSVVGDVIRDIARSGGRARAYGEMVALLWDAGNITAAIELEMLWNDLLAEVEFSLFCAYPSSVTEEGQDEALRHVCELHSEVNERSSKLHQTRAFPFSSESPGEARHFVVELLRPWASDELLDDASIIATELATNAIVHAKAGFTLSVRTRAGAVRIEVHDPTHAMPVIVDQPVGTGGRGLHLVAAIAKVWGADAGPGGKTVWVDLDAAT